jgi:hypothetical protein
VLNLTWVKYGGTVRARAIICIFPPGFHLLQLVVYYSIVMKYMLICNTTGMNCLKVNEVSFLCFE